MNVANRKCVRHLSLRSLRANRMRNLVAVLAIVLTAPLGAFAMDLSYKKLLKKG